MTLLAHASRPLPPLPRILILDYHDSYTHNLLTLLARAWGDAAVRTQVVVVEADAWTWDECRAALDGVDGIILSPGPGRPDNPADILYGLDLLRSTRLPVLGVCLGMQALGVAYGGDIIHTPRIRHGQVVRVRHAGRGVMRGLPRGGVMGKEDVGARRMDHAHTAGDEREGHDEVADEDDDEQDDDDDDTPAHATATAAQHGEVDVVLYNSLAVDEATLPAELRVDAWVDEEPEAELGGPSSPGITAADGTTMKAPRRTIQALAHRSRPQWGVQFHPESIASTGGSEILAEWVRRVWACHGRPAHFPPLEEALVRQGTGARGAVAVTPPRDLAGQHLPTLHVREERLPLRGDADVEDVFERVFRARRWPLGEVWWDGQSPNAPTTNSMAHPAFVLAYDAKLRRVVCHYPATAAPSVEESERVSGVAEADYPLALGTTFWSVLSDLQRALQARIGGLRDSDSMEASPSSTPSRFVGGLVGWFAYEMKIESLCGYAADPREEGNGSNEPAPRIDACWAFVDRLVERDGAGRWTARGVVHGPGQEAQPAPADMSTSTLLDWLEALPGLRIGCPESAWGGWITDVAKTLDQPGPAQSAPPLPLPPMPAFQPNIPAASYIDGIRRCREAIHAGDSYELTLTCQFHAAAPAQPLDAYALYRRLRARNPAPYSAYLDLPTLDTRILSSSPERFIRISRHGEVQMKPIKGTRARVRCVCSVAGQANCVGPGGEDCAAWCEAEDAAVGKELGEDKKERAENLMIVDLIRADLLSFCAPSSVQVPKLIALETYPKVHQLVTTVVGDLKPGITPIEAVQRCFPPGSMTGAPKLRSVQILDELERHRRRGAYSGALGYISLDGSLDLSVVIRTIVQQGKNMTIGGGGAITWLSDPDREWEEVLTKVGSVTR